MIPESELVAAIVNAQFLELLAEPLELQFHTNELEAIQKREAEKASSVAAMMREVNNSVNTGTLRSPEARQYLSMMLGQMGLPTVDELALPDEEPPAPPPVAEPPIEESPPDAEKKVHGAAPAPLWSELARWRKTGKAQFNSDIIPDWYAGCVRAAIAWVGHDDAFLFLKQADARGVIENRLRRKVRKVLRRYQVQAQEMIAAGREIDYNALFADLQAALRPELEAIATQRALAIGAEIGVQFDPAVINTAAADWVRDYSFGLVTRLTNTTREVLRRAMTTVIETPGILPGDLAQLLEPAFGAYRAEMIAVTEVTRAYAQAENQYQREIAEYGVEMRRIWHTAMDDKVCAICGPLDGLREDGPKGWAAQFPDGPPAHPNCRCGLGLSAMPPRALDETHAERQKVREQMLAELGVEQ